MAGHRAVGTDEITRDLAPGSVQVRLRGREPAFVVTAPPAEPVGRDAASVPETTVPPLAGQPDATDGAMARINFRPPEGLKARIEEAAGREGLSVNAWLVRTASAALDPGERRGGPTPRTPATASPAGWARPAVALHRRPPRQETAVIPTFETPDPIAVTLDGYGTHNNAGACSGTAKRLLTSSNYGQSEAWEWAPCRCHSDDGPEPLPRAWTPFPSLPAAFPLDQVRRIGSVSIELTLLSRVAYRGQDISGPRRRGLLALLATDLRGGCDAARLIDELWPEGPPDRPAKALQSLVSRTRAQLGSGVILSTPTGYRLSLDEEQVDAAAILVRAAAAARAARAGDPATALAQAERGLELWDGTGPDDDPADPVATLRSERRPVHRSLERLRAIALARLGRHAAALAPLTSLIDDHASDEELLLELLRCEAAELGPAAALRRYDAYRRALRAEIGLDPGIDLQALHQQLLDSDRPPIRLGVPHEPNPLLGRAADVAAVAELLHTSRVVSIVGTGGLGKTRLAVAACHRSDHRAVYLVPLAGISSAADVAGEVASALGVTWAPTGRRADGTVADIAGRIVRTIGPGRALLVLDNCEHVADGVAELVGALVAMSPTLQVLTTSRAPLGLTSEVVHYLPGLSLAAAVELFEQRARAVRPGVELRPEPLARLCARLDGLPLAVELAAARVRTMSVTEIADGMADRRFALLRGGARDTPERHHTLAAVVEWSWNLLDATGQRAMRMLSVFPDGFTPAAAGRMLGDADVPEVLERLVEQSLLIVTDTPSGTRMRMLETVREFSARTPRSRRGHLPGTGRIPRLGA